MASRGVLVAAVLTVSLVGGVAARSQPMPPLRVGGTYRVVSPGIDSIDPAISYGPAAPYLRASCAFIAEVESRPPKVSADGKTYTFTLRKTFRFNTGTKVTALSFAHELDRVLNPDMNSPAASIFRDIVGADSVTAGNAMHATGLVAKGYTLTIHLVRPVPDLPARLTDATACPVPPTLPSDPQAVTAPASGAGPYYIDEYSPGQRLVLRRNRFYHGSRPHRVDRIVVTIVNDDSSALAALVAGEADWADLGDATAYAALPASQRARVRVLSAPALGMRYLFMNTSRPLFRNNVALRRAVNFALDRTALVNARGGSLIGNPTDHYLPASMLGYRNIPIYPLRHPDLKRALALARGHRRSGTIVVYGRSDGPAAAEAPIVQRALTQIGLKVELKLFPGEQFFTRISNPSEPYDLTIAGLVPDYVDPFEYLNLMLDGRQLQVKENSNFSRFDNPRYNRLLARAARLQGRARSREYGRLDVLLARDAAPMAAYMNQKDLTFVSRRTGCLKHAMDLAAVCLR